MKKEEAILKPTANNHCQNNKKYMYTCNQYNTNQKKILTKNIKKDAVGFDQVKTPRIDLIKPVIGLIPAAREKEKYCTCN